MDVTKTRQVALNLAGYICIALLSILLFMLLAGGRFADTLAALGLYHEKGGIYVDCSSPAARGNRFCEPPRSPEDKTWKALKSKVPFSLSGEP